MSNKTKRKRVRLDDPMSIGKNGEGRRPDGKFAKGNAAAQGRSNPCARKQVELRMALYEEATADDARAVLRNLINSARRGEAWAVKECMKRLVGDSFIGPVPEPAEVDLAGAELERRIHTAEAVQRLASRADKNVSEQLIADLEVLAADGLPLEAAAGLAGSDPQVFEKWVELGEAIITGKRKAKTDGDRLAVLFVEAWRRGEAKHRRRLLELRELAMLERRDPKHFGRRDPDAEADDFDPDERFV